ncbi:GlxA family transcriptional regulator [Kushneria aurantia]|uniref:GlxA family transcriptional regulator n=1 Tax=Kushneria aurantia TaxID=504092 RepID=A0ABV6FZL4_9GAMM|nr:GlxA family transcriptional regulator [Kushneria aurantia]
MLTKTDLPPLLSPREAAITLDVWLLPKFSMLTLFCLLEPLRVANRLGRPLFAWRLLSSDGEPVVASNGVGIDADAAFDDVPRGDMLVVVASFEAEAAVSARHHALLRRTAGRNMPIAALDTAPFILARAGVLEGYRVAVHWESLPAFLEDFAHLNAGAARYIIDGKRLTGAGGAAGIDMMLSWIEQGWGQALADAIARQLLHQRQTSEESPGQALVGEGYTLERMPTPLAKALAIMEATTASPLSIAELGQRVGRSPRQLARLYDQYLHMAPRQCYLVLRLDRARRILIDSRISVTQAALATGFEHVAHFSRAYRQRFGEPPSVTAGRSRSDT